jgi:hypothetical protein
LVVHTSPRWHARTNGEDNYGSGSVLEYSVDGEKIEKTMPFTELVIPAGTYEAKIRNPVLGTEKKVNFTIEENKIQLLE